MLKKKKLSRQPVVITEDNTGNSQTPRKNSEIGQKNEFGSNFKVSGLFDIPLM